MHLYIKEPVLSVCKKCGKEILPQNVCHYCGYYKGMEVIDTLKKLTKKERKKKEREIASKERKEKKEKPLTMESLSKK